MVLLQIPSKCRKFAELGFSESPACTDFTVFSSALKAKFDKNCRLRRVFRPKGCFRGTERLKLFMKRLAYTRLFTLLLGIALLSASTVSCVKKGEEDPILSFRSRTARLMGNWDVKSIQISPLVDLTEYWVPGVSESCQMEFANHHLLKEHTLDFSNDGSVRVRIMAFENIFLSDSCFYEDVETNIDQLEKWAFNEDETKLLVSNDNGADLTRDEYVITRLSNEEMILTFDVVLNFILDADGGILQFDAPQTYQASMKLEKI